MSRARSDGRALRALVAAIAAVGLVLPILAGVWLTFRAAAGVYPAIGFDRIGGHAFAALWAQPGIGRAVALSLWTGIGATAGALILALALAYWLERHLSPSARARLVTPLLAVPHAAIAIGLAFVLAPSGWIARLLAPLAGWERPPMLATVQDEWGLVLMLGLVVKEVPFLTFLALAALGQVPLRRHVAVARALGYAPGTVWLKVIVPQVWPLLRLPVLVVLAYGVSVVDMALILGPSTPPTLSVLLLRLFTAPDLAMILHGSAGAVVQIAVMVIAVLFLLATEAFLRRIGRLWVRTGARAGAAARLVPAAAFGALGLLAIGALAILSLGLWSVAWRWPWPGLLPESWSLRAWAAPGAGWADAFATTGIIALASTALALALAIAWLEGEDRGHRSRAGWAEGLIYLPLLVPQIAFLAGLNVAFLRLGVDAGIGSVIWVHTVFVFPYVMIALSDPWRALDPRLTRSAAALGAGPWKRLWSVKLPVLLAPILAAAAIGIAVSVAQYLPTLFIGAGRVGTLTTEAVTLASGADRRVTGVYGSLQALLPILGFAAALLIPALRYRNRAGLRGGGQA